MIKFTCPLCNHSHLFPDEQGGDYVPCPKCERLISIPKPPRPVLETPPENHAVQAEPSTQSNVGNVNIAPVKISGMAIASLVTGVLGITVCLWLPIPVLFPLVAIVLGHVSYSRISKQPDVLLGRGLSIAGFTMGYVGLVAGIMVIALLISLSESFAELEASMNRFENMFK